MIKDTFKVIAISVLVAIIVSFEYLLGYYIGLENAEKSVIDNIIVTNKEHQEGFYIVEYKGKEYCYWYEE